jgi:hypothetical protein
VIGGPHNLKQLGLLVLQDLHSWFKRLDRNNIAPLQSCPRAETSTMFSHIFHECLSFEELSCTIPVISTGIFTNRRSSLRFSPATMPDSAPGFLRNKFVWLSDF